jgi:AAA+ superfamily predicted ATPase
MARLYKYFLIVGLILSSLLAINPASAMDLKSRNLALEPNQQDHTQDNAQADAEDKERLQYFDGTPTSELDLVFEGAPPEAKMIVRHLQDPSFLKKPGYRAAFLVGEPGTGKSTLAKAIAYQMYKTQRWKYLFDDATSFAGEYRGGTAMNLMGHLNAAVQKQSKKVVIIDEINQLLDHAESTRHDTDTTSKALWTFLDKQQGNSNFFLIGTMNDCTKIPQQIKSRIVGSCIELKPVENFFVKKEAFLSKLVNATTQLHPECDDTFLKAFFMPLQDWSNRDLASLACEALKMFKLEDDQSAIATIRKRHLEAGYHKLMAARKLLHFGEKVETDEECRERHFVQGQLLQHAVNANMVSGERGGITQHHITEEGIAEIMGIFCPEKQMPLVQAIRTRSQEAKRLKKRELDALAANESCSIQ